MDEWKDKKCLICEDCGQWKWYLEVDLRELKLVGQGDGSAIESPFKVVQRHDTWATSMNVYNHITLQYVLPDSADVDAVKEAIESITSNAKTWTKGFVVKWNGNNWMGTWGEDSNEFFWQDFERGLTELEVLENYDLSDYENLPHIKENVVAELCEEKVKHDEGRLPFIANIEAILHRLYPPNDMYCYYFGHDKAAVSIADELLETVA